MLHPAILFDAGHTLIEPTESALEDAASAAGLGLKGADIARSFRSVISQRNRHHAAGPRNNFRQLMHGALEALGVDRSARRDTFWQRFRELEATCSVWLEPIAGAAQMLAALHNAGVRIGVISNSDGTVATSLERAGLAQFCEIIIDSHVVGIEKPDPRIFHMGRERLGAPEGISYVGDRYEVDVVGARAAALHPILFDPSEEACAFDCKRILDLIELTKLA